MSDSCAATREMEPTKSGSPLTRIKTKYCDVQRTTAFEIRPVKCKCAFCPKCQLGRGLLIRKKLEGVADEFKRPLMVTLTVDPKQFESQEAAYDYVLKNRCVARLMRSLRNRKLLLTKSWFCVFEVHKSGAPHWHLMLDCNFIDSRVIDAAWNRMGPDGHLGFIKVSRRGTFKNPIHAIRYLTKYLLKTPENEWPAWVKNKKRIRRFSTSRGLFGLTERKEAKGVRGKYTPEKSIFKRVAKCCTKSVLLALRISGARRFVASVPVSWDVVSRSLGTDQNAAIVSPVQAHGLYHGTFEFDEYWVGGAP